MRSYERLHAQLVTGMELDFADSSAEEGLDARA